LFRFDGQQHAYPVGKVSDADADLMLTQVEHVVGRLKAGLIQLPPSCDIITFIQHNGTPPVIAGPTSPVKQFAEIKSEYLLTFGNGAIEANTHSTSIIHLRHIEKTLGQKFAFRELSFQDLQRHINHRTRLSTKPGVPEPVASVTVKKELDTLRSMWNWAKRMGYVQGDFPISGLVYSKSDEKLPFMAWPEIERRIEAGGDPDLLWECLYLREQEM